MAHPKLGSKVKRKGKAASTLAAASLVATAGVSTPADAVPGPSASARIGVEEISDVSLATFHLFDGQKTATSKPLIQLARGCGRGCGGRGCGGFRGCGGRGCGGFRGGFGIRGCGGFRGCAGWRGCGCGGCGGCCFVVGACVRVC